MGSINITRGTPQPAFIWLHYKGLNQELSMRVEICSELDMREAMILVIVLAREVKRVPN